MASGPSPELPFWFAYFPGAVLHLRRDGTVIQSNGRIDAIFGKSLEGLPFLDFLDPDTSHRKWERILQLEEANNDAASREWELVLAGRKTLDDARSFTVVYDDRCEEFWMFEARSHRRMADLKSEIFQIGAILTQAQRELVKERGQLAAALDDLASEHEISERLNRTVQAQNVELQRINEDLDDFVSIVSHDLKAPLRGISQYASWLRDDIGNSLPGDSLKHLERLQNLATRLRSMINGALLFARAGRGGAAVDQVDISLLIDEAIAILDPPADVKFEREIQIGPFGAVRSALRQAILNLLGNAAKFADLDRPVVTIRARKVEEFLEVTVSDNGPGIPPEHHERIWRLFHTLEPDDASEVGGIGLALVKKYVEGQGGRVWVDSEGEHGSTFGFLWPVVDFQRIERALPSERSIGTGSIAGRGDKGDGDKQ